MVALANLILEDSIERVYVKSMYGDIPGGTYLVRGENVVLIGEIVSACLPWRILLLF